MQRETDLTRTRSGQLRFGGRTFMWRLAEFSRGTMALWFCKVCEGMLNRTWNGKGYEGMPIKNLLECAYCILHI